ncbi:MAG TPA: SulP family inorganic anion transporter [Actinomycetes bacterium]|nr:SulP family inorganic anion transporter [Actinomycetes bacterium]
MLRHARRRAHDWLRSVAPQRATLKTDALAGLPGAIGSVPDGMAASVLTGVNPIHGLYASFAGPVAGGLTASTKLMVITTTSAAALAAGSALEGLSPEERPGALFLLTLIAGAAMVAAGLLRLGRFTRFVSHSVMIGFLSGVAVNIIAGQIPDVTGAQAEGSIALQKAWDVVVHPSRIDPASLLAGAAALAIIVVLGRTRIAAFSAVVALVVPTVAVILAGADVAQVEDQGDIPRGVPLPAWPELSAFSMSLLAGALAVAAIVLVQGVGVAESAPNDDGSRSDANADFVAQGVGNLSSGFFQGQPVGGSVGQTALNRTAGARNRWAAIFSGLWMLLILALFSGVVGVVAMPTLAALLIYAAAGSLRFGQIATIWRTGLTSQIAIAATFLATLLLPVATAVGLGVILSLLLQLNQAALDLKVVELVPHEDGRLEERAAPTRVASHSVILLDVYGSLHYAGARTLQHHLPDPTGTEGPAVVLRMRGRSTLGATFFTVLAGYGRQLDDVGGRLYVAGIDPALMAQAERTGSIPKDGPVKLYEARPVIGQSSLDAFHDAQRWVEAR